MAIGSNLGDREYFCRKALAKLQEKAGIWVCRCSRVYLSPPAGFSSQNWFYNLVCEIRTSLSPAALLFHLWQIELSCGRVRTGELADRTLDLDLLLYEDLILEGETLKLPHPRLHERAFVLGPLLELIPEEKHPILEKSFKALWEDLSQKERAKIRSLKHLCFA
ncbi:MAG: 2-amino-4-hydroxy-6-hydroxymethyldihydropteridine diphosphokinase [Thermodesulfobacteria bacterium]|nr:2-amino-4-hydroxy-6-hydroxymethyldihydropteridine diphosphokinase [Thermodesulfobacteriota bacterium]